MTAHHTVNKNWFVALVLSFFFGTFGFDRFYLGCIGTGVIKLLTFGGLGIWALIDFIRLLTGSKLCGGFKWIDAHKYGLQGGSMESCCGTNDYIIIILSTIIGLAILYTYILPWFRNKYYGTPKQEKNIIKNND